MKSKEEIQKVIEDYENDILKMNKSLDEAIPDIGQKKQVRNDISRYQAIIDWLKWVLK